MNQNLTRAISEWKQILPDYRILLEYKDLQKYSLSTLGDQYKVLCSLLPISTKELSRIVIIANKYKIKIFSLSKGNNHGYNSATAMADNFVIIDLQNINQILEYNQEFGYVVIEPGTSFIDLYKYLASRNSDYMMSSFSGNPNSSIIGNALERGTGKGSYGNRELCSIVKEIVLADGRIIELRSNYQVRDLTDFARYSTTGIDISSLFYQSNLAIITKMIVYLEPIPNHLLIVSVNLNNDEGMLQLFSRLRQLNRLGITKPCYSVYNDIRAIVGSGLYKRPKTNITQNLENIIRDFYSKAGNKINKWNSSFAVHCYCKEDLQIKQKIITKHLQGIVNCLSFHKIKKNDAKLLINKSISNNFIEDSKDSKFLSNLGYSNLQDQNTLYWASKQPFNTDYNVISDNCGLIFFTLKIPFSSGHVGRCLNLLTELANKHNMELPIMFQCKSMELIYLILPILFDMGNKQVKASAINFYQELYQEFIQIGYIPYRANNISAFKIFNKKSDLQKLLNKIKLTFDENHILSIHRYS